MRSETVTLVGCRWRVRWVQLMLQRAQEILTGGSADNSEIVNLKS